MTAKKPTLLLDTNIWLDYFLGYRPGHEAAVSLIELADRTEATTAYASLSAKDVFYIVSAEVKRLAREQKGVLSPADALAARQIAWGCVRNLVENAVAVPLGEPQVWLASQYEDLHGDFEDDLILAALETAKPDYFVTNDEALRRKAPVAAFDPPALLDYLRKRGELGLS